VQAEPKEFQNGTAQSQTVITDLKQMIQFFRKIRQKLLSENRFSRYLVYAVGEIVLVVIGILIALQINNWNLERISRSELKLVYQIIKADLVEDINETGVFIKDYKERHEEVFRMWIHEPPTKEQWDANPDLYDMFKGYSDFSINQRGYELLKGLSTSTILEDSLAEKVVRFYEDHALELEIAAWELNHDFTDNWLHFKKYNWPIDFYNYNQTDSYFKYLTEDVDAKRRMAIYSNLYAGYAWEMYRYKENAQQLVQEIDQYLDK
jgi:hypothetical protein